MFISDAVLFERVFIFDWVIKRKLKTGADFLSIVFAKTVLSVCGVDPSDLCCALGPYRFAIHVCVKGLEVGEYSAFQFSGRDGAADADNNFSAVKSVSLPCREGDSVEECAEIDCADWECIDVVEWGRCWYCAVIRVN